MCKRYRLAALLLGSILSVGTVSFEPGNGGVMVACAAEEGTPEELGTAFQDEVCSEGENVDTESTMEEQEYQILLRIVEAEAGGEDMIGKMLVAGVVLNRVKSEAFPGSVTEVVYEKSNGTAQFSPTVDGRLDTVSVSADTEQAVTRVLNGEDISQGALYFRSIHCDSGWFDRALSRVCEYGNHIFYTL
ncbi:MAG: cell wall hydrolase [Lachnospiraceae bacterium]|nr:cell wall hydrolase [Lachnospiraceae bacterium]MCD8248903.1 cell wall hydrolase [Lachnospiraceae bacterium]